MIIILILKNRKKDKQLTVCLNRYIFKSIILKKLNH